MSENQRIKKHNFDPFLIAKHTSYDQRSLLVPHIGNWLADINNYWKAKKIITGISGLKSGKHTAFSCFTDLLDNLVC